MTHSGNSSDEGPGERPPGSTSLSLIDGLKRGDDDAWRRLVFLYTPLLRWWCRRWQLSPEDAEDVGQKVFLALRGRIGEFERQHPGGFRAWL